MCRNIRGFRQFIYSFLILFTFLILSYCLLRLIDVNFHMLWLQLQSMLLGESLKILCSRLGCSGGLAGAMVCAVKALLTSEAAPYLGHMVLPAGPESGASSASELVLVDGGFFRDAGPVGAFFRNGNGGHIGESARSKACASL